MWLQSLPRDPLGLKPGPQPSTCVTSLRVDVVFGKDRPPVSEWYLPSSRVSLSFSYKPQGTESARGGGDGTGEAQGKGVPPGLHTRLPPSRPSPPRLGYLLQQLQGSVLVPCQALRLLHCLGPDLPRLAVQDCQALLEERGASQAGLGDNRAEPTGRPVAWAEVINQPFCLASTHRGENRQLRSVPPLSPPSTSNSCALPSASPEPGAQ